MHRFFIASEDVQGDIVYFDQEQSRHIEKVLRLKIGDQVVAFDGTGREYLVQLEAPSDSGLRAVVLSQAVVEREASLKLVLVQGLAKGDKMDTIIQKAVEIGVHKVQPVITQRTVVRLDKNKARKKVERWQVVAREACKQCGRNRVPAISQVLGFNELLEEIKGSPAVILYEREEQQGLKNIVKEQRTAFLDQGVYLIVGPEGGFSPEEVDRACAYGVVPATLGPRILRTETAGLVAASIMFYEYDDLG
ncbi:16S rRNA (uracil(1498)-N(3))-methyltransferase [Syntrophomonas erecta]